MSAVSKWFTPASSAASTTCLDASSSIRMPKLLHPRPATETSRLPTVRISIAVSSRLPFDRRAARPTLPPPLVGSLGPVDEVGEAYRGVRLRVSTLVTDADVATLDTVAPATPGWTVHDVLAHLVGVATDIVSGNLDGVGSDPWAAAQVERSRERTCVELLAEWDEHGPVVDEMAAQFGRAAGQLLSDTTTHEHDVRGALDAGGARNSDAVGLSFGFLGLSLAEQLDAAGVGALTVRHGDMTDTLGSGEAVASLHIDDFEFVRALTGRRSVEQIAAYDWDGWF